MTDDIALKTLESMVAGQGKNISIAIAVQAHSTVNTSIEY